MKFTKREWAFLGLIFTFALVWFALLGRHGNLPDLVVSPTKKQAVPVPISTPTINLDHHTSSPQPPSKKEYIEDLEQDPHMVPRSLMRYASKIAKLQEQARLDPFRAEKLMRELENCALSTQVMDTVRIFCARQSRNLARENPKEAHLSERADALREVLHHLSQQGIGELSSR